MTKKLAVEQAAAVGEALHFEDRVFVHTISSMAVETAAVLALRSFLHSAPQHGGRPAVHHAPVILGPTASGKSALARDVVSLTGHQMMPLPLTSVLAPASMASSVASLLRRDRGSVLRPVLKGKAVLVLDDIHLPFQVKRGPFCGLKRCLRSRHIGWSMEVWETACAVLGIDEICKPDDLSGCHI